MSCITLAAPLGNSLYQLLVVQAFRPDRVLTMVHKVVETVFGQSFLRASEQELDLAFIVEKEVRCCAFLELITFGNTLDKFTTSITHMPY
jgi:hypothetical protein